MSGRWKAASSWASASPERIWSVEARPPTSKAMASMRRDLPAPVSPVRTINPDWNCRLSCSMSAKLTMRNSASIAAGS